MVHPSGRLFKGGECDDVYREFGRKNFPLPETMGQPDCQNIKKLDAITPHIEKILREVDVELIKSARITVAIDSINGAAGVIFPRLLSKLGVAWIGVHNKIDGDFVHNPEPRPEHLTDLSALMKKTDRLWGGFIFDPDADRLALMGEHGEPVTEEMTLVLACENILSRKPSPIATNLSTSMMVDDVARKYGVRVIRTKIGEANVVEGLLGNACTIGGEGNGGVIYPAISTVRDGLAGIALILELMAKTNKTVMDLVKQRPLYPLVKDKIPCENNDPHAIIRKLTELFKNETIDEQDGLKIVRDYGWVHIRPSNTEPIIRCYAEATTVELANRLVAMVIDKI
jgi:phosphomannomutase